MNSLEQFAGCVFCDISWIAIIWFPLLAIIGSIGLLISIYELYVYKAKHKNIGKSSSQIVSIAHSMLIGTGLSYGIFSRVESVDGFGDGPAISAVVVSFAVYSFLRKFGHTAKIHAASLLFVTLGLLLLWLVDIEGEATATLIFTWLLIVCLIVLLIALLNHSRRK